MAGTKAGAAKAVLKIKKVYGEEHYKTIGGRGGSQVQANPRGFARMSPEQREAAGRKGGTMSRRRPR